MPEVINTDVLVVGGGGAGCRAAIEAHDRGVDVLLLVKGELGNSGCTLNVGTSAAVGPWAEEGDSDLVSMRDLLAHGGFLGDQELVKILVEESMDRVLELERWGIDFERDDDGSIAINRSAEHTFPRNFAFKPRSPSQHDYGSAPGIAMMDVLVGEVRTRGIRVLDEAVLVDLLVAEGRVVGATGLDCRRNELVVLMAKAVVLATGTYSQVYSHTSVSPHETGDGQAAAYRAGAELIDMENTQFVPTSVGFPPGSIFLNGKGERFLERYGIESREGVSKERMCHAVWSEVLEGRGTDDEMILIDMTGVWRSEAGAAFMSAFEETLRTRGSAYPGFEGDPVDPRKEPFPTSPLAHTTTGGVRINTRCEASVPGLYAAGAVTGGVYGHARPEGYTSMITVVFGRRAGLYASEACRGAAVPAVAEEALQASIGRATTLGRAAGGVEPAGAKTRIQSAMRKHAWVIKDEAGLKAGLKEITETGEMQWLRTADPSLGIPPGDGHDWAAAMEVPNLLLCSELMLEGAEMRKESRGAFFRREYPDADDEKWLRNIIHKQVEGRRVVETVPVDLKYCGPEPSLAKGGLS